jgi:hypothetical protein
LIKIASQLILFFFAIFSVKNSYISNTKLWFHFNYLFKLLADANYHKILNFENINLLKNFQASVKCIKVLFLHIKITEIQICLFLVMQHKQVYIFIRHEWLRILDETLKIVDFWCVSWLTDNSPHCRMASKSPNTVESSPRIKSLSTGR